MSNVPVPILYVEGDCNGSDRGPFDSLTSLLEHLDRTRFVPVLVVGGELPPTPGFNAAAGDVRVIKRRRPFRVGIASAPAGITRARRALQSAINVVRFSANVVWLSDVIRRENAQLVQLNVSVTTDHDWMFAAMLARVPCIAHEREVTDRDPARAPWWVRRLVRIICVSPAVFDNLAERGVAKAHLVVIEDGLDPASMAAYAARTMALYEEVLKGA